MQDPIQQAPIGEGLARPPLAAAVANADALAIQPAADIINEIAGEADPLLRKWQKD